MHPFSNSAAIPNLRICVDYFYQCKSARLAVNAANNVSDLLLRFEHDHPVEWGFSGWKNDLIADVVLGCADYGDEVERRRIAEYWFTRHWAKEKKAVRQNAIENNDRRRRAMYAALELKALRANDSPQLTTSPTDSGPVQAARGTNSELPPNAGFWDVMWNAFADSVANMKWTHDLDESYNSYAAFVRWLTNNVRNLPYEPGKGAFVQAAVQKFRRERPRVKLAERALLEICTAFGRCYKPDREHKKIAYTLDPSKVILDVVAHRYGVSTGLVGKVRAEMNKKNPRR